MDRLGTALEIKQVDTSQRIISGYAAFFGNIDRVADIIEPGAFTKTLSEKQPGDIAVFIGHQSATLPVGIPIKIESDGHGLHTETKIFDGPVGDNLLAVARGLQAHGQTLGLSIGYRPHPGGAEYTRVDGKSIRRLKSIDLAEYSFAARQTIANESALMTGIKQRGDNELETDETDTTQAEEHAAAQTQEAKGAAPVTDLPNSAFLYVEPGDDDESGLRVPRSKRHFAYRDSEGKIDAAALSIAVKAIPDADMPGLDMQDRNRLAARGRRMLEADQKAEELDSAEWKAASPALDLVAVAYRLIDTAHRVVDEHKALVQLGDDTKGGKLVRAELRQSITEAMGDLKRVVDSAEIVAKGQEEKAAADWWRAQFDFSEVTV